ncbi:MAG: PepSY-like domain-containing protein [Chitinophagales bacterium]|nr:PepSY-like domain-containing protein [Chitinophagales bacterium]
MKSLISNTLVALLLLLATGCEKEKVIAAQDLPATVQTYISTHFTGNSITKAVKQKDKNELYEVTLSDGTKLEFNAQNEVIDIDGKSKLPNSVIPNKILDYVTVNYPSNYIVGWELQNGNQEVQLNNQTVLLFNSAGDFLRIEE